MTKTNKTGCPTIVTPEQSSNFPPIKGAPEWPADHVERRQVGNLIPYARNARTHSDAQISQLAAAIREWGWTVPILIAEDGTIIAGHGRVMAAQKLGLADVPVMVARGWSEAQKRAYVLADNRLAMDAGWDEAMLAIELGDIKSAEFDLSLTGFDIGELDDLLGASSSMVAMGDAPESVRANVDDMEEVKRARREGNEEKAQKSDTEHYIVVVFDTRDERQATLKRLGLPDDERYVHARMITVKRRFGALSRVSADRSIKAASPRKSGATG